MNDYKFIVKEFSDYVFPEMIPINELGEVVFVNNVAEALNAEIDGAKNLIWTGSNLSILEELSPIKRKYGWMLISVNLPIYLDVSSIQDLANIENINLKGFYSENVDQLFKIKKKLESLQP